MSSLPDGIVTILLTDIAGSTQLWEESPEATRAAVIVHDKIVGDVVAAHRGFVVKSTGDGVLAAFAVAESGVRAAVDAQRLIRDEEWSELPGGLGVRMALHTGEAAPLGDDYRGSIVNVASRIEETGHAGQILLSEATVDALDQPGSDIDTVLLATRVLRGVAEPVAIWQLVVDGLPRTFPPLRARKEYAAPDSDTSFIVRHADQDLPDSPS